MINSQQIKKDFPIFHHKPGLTYLDSTATALKPKSVIDKEVEYYAQYSANIYRGIYEISEKATEEYEKTRTAVQKFIGSDSPDEVVFTRNTTESINLIAYSLGRQLIKEGDEVVTTIMEHHSNFVPWQQLAFENGADFKVIGVDEKGYLLVNNEELRITEEIENAITKKTKILALTYISNVLGTINPVKKIIKAAKEINPEIITIVDAAQAVPHMKVDVQDLGCDFFAFSGHKMLGPTGVGVLWGKRELLETMYPFMYGGEMILVVDIAKSTFKNPPHKFEAGTPHIAGVIALRAAIEYLEKLDMKLVRKHEEEMAAYGYKKLKEHFGDTITILGPENAHHRCGVLSFMFGTYHPHDIAQILSDNSVAVRAGHHCAMPLHTYLHADATTRASFYVYNSKEDVDKLVKGLAEVKNILG